MIVEIISTLALFIALAFINLSVIYIYRQKIKWFFNEVYSKALKRNTPLQKEIKAERKEIKRLEQHKADMEELERLKVQRKKLFEEVQESEVEREEVLVICDSCGNYMDYLGIDRSRREVYECKDCNHTLKGRYVQTKRRRMNEV